MVVRSEVQAVVMCQTMAIGQIVAKPTERDSGLWLLFAVLKHLPRATADDMVLFKRLSSTANCAVI